jgi:hypothetical protein
LDFEYYNCLQNPLLFCTCASFRLFAPISHPKKTLKN